MVLMIVICVAADDNSATDKPVPKKEKYVKILQTAKNNEQEIIDIRRQLHRRPATMYEEYEAQELVIEKLSELGMRSASS